ncbi:hypothetical protein BJX66DRAFT_347412 [Aspergillus keveii]|uniref:Zn(2)-C6 fungal-type domain-containing protein n=1 Tax=Aspergillus keveii TaxID=714993 RepID=A0ABR4FQL9_9EURO
MNIVSPAYTLPRMAENKSYPSSSYPMLSPPKPYRRPRRAPAHLRTKTGCLTCRKRRKKCDEQQGTCRNCDRRWLTCIWPSPPVADASCTLTRSQEAPGALPVTSADIDGSQEPPPSSTACYTTSPRTARGQIAAQEDGDGDLSRALGNHPHKVPTPPTLPRTVPLVTGALAVCTKSAVFDLVRSKWLRELFRPMASASLIQSCYQQSMAMAMHTPFYMHALLASCAAEYPVQNARARDYFPRLSAKHYVRAITGLREALGHADSVRYNIDIASTVLILCIYERAKPGPSSGVGAHLSGLAQLVKSGLSDRGSSDIGLTGGDDALRRVVLEGFIFHASTSVPFDSLPNHQTANLDFAIQLAQGALDTISNPAYGLLEHADSPVLGAPPGLFVLIRKISLMHRQHDLGRADYDCRFQRCQELHVQLSQYRYLHQKGAFSTEFSDITDGGGTTPSNNPASLGPMLYILAAEILLADMLQGVQLVGSLQPAIDYYAEYYGWPIYVLVRFASRKQDRDILLARVEAFYEATRNGTMARLAETLRGNSS